MTWKDNIKKAKRMAAEQSNLDTDEAEKIIDDLESLIERMVTNFDGLVASTSYTKTEEEQSEEKIGEFVAGLRKFVDFLESNAMSEM
tara:strand:+ start:511 stop:771 length:261 start_codon:yes stop_codon:yes gene_type:complete